MSEPEKNPITLSGIPITYTQEQIEVIKNTFAVGATLNELKLFVYIAEKTKLDILTRQVHFVKRKRWNANAQKFEEVASYQIGIDGYVEIANRVRGLKGEVLLDGFKVKAIVEKDDKGKEHVTGAQATVWRKDFSHPIEFEIDFEEYCQKKDGKPTALWESKPKIMIEKCCLALALRRTFPQFYAGTYVPEELDASVPLSTINVEEKILEERNPQDVEPTTTPPETPQTVKPEPVKSPQPTPPFPEPPIEPTKLADIETPKKMAFKWKVANKETGVMEEKPIENTTMAWQNIVLAAVRQISHAQEATFNEINPPNMKGWVLGLEVDKPMSDADRVRLIGSIQFAVHNYFKIPQAENKVEVTYG